jgi:hypothetical protein
VLPTGRIFGRLTQKGPNKKQSDRTNCGRILAAIVQKGLKRGRTSRKFVFLLFLSRHLEKSKKCFTIPTDTDKDNFVLLLEAKNAFNQGKCMGTDFFPQRPNFSAELARKVCQEFATLIIICRLVDQESRILCISYSICN